MTKNLFEINQDEKDRILNLHESHSKNHYLNLITERLQFNKNVQNIQKALRKLGFKQVGKADGLFGKKTACAVHEFQMKHGINTTILTRGKVDDKTAKKLSELSQMDIGKYILSNVDVITACNSDKKSNDETNENTKQCTSILPETCSRISPSRETDIGNGGNEGCSEYVRKSIGITLDDAWKAFNNSKKYGVKYNLFTNGSVDWNNVRNQMKLNSFNSKNCGCFLQTGKDLDAKCPNGGKFSKTITSFYPSSSSFDINSLRLGDIVGMYYNHSLNKGKAFCTRASDRGLDIDGNVKDNDPFTFNTHVGYVGAIKDGMPIIYHSTGGQRKATPASQLKSKNGDAMIVWVTGGKNFLYNKFKDLF